MIHAHYAEFFTFLEIAMRKKIPPKKRVRKMVREDVIAEVTAAFLGGGDEPATWAACAYDAGYREAREDAAKLAEHPYRIGKVDVSMQPVEVGEEIAAEIRKLEPSNLASEQEAANGIKSSK